MSEEAKVEELARYLKIGLIAVVVVALGIAGFVALKKQKEQKIVKAFSALVLTERMEETALREADALKKDGDSTSALQIIVGWSPEKKAEYSGALTKITQEHKGTTAATMAALKLARWHFYEKKYTEARAFYEQVIAEAAGEEADLFRAMAYDGIGVSYETEGKLAEALATYEKAVALKGNALKALAYMGRARVLKEQGQAEQARQNYDLVIKEFPNSSYEKRARVLKAFVEAGA